MIRRVALSLLIACVVPATLFYVCVRVLGVWPAIIAALGWTYAAIAWRAATGRRTSGLLLLTAVVMTGRTLIALLSDSTFLYFLQPVIGDGVVAATFLLSLATRPADGGPAGRRLLPDGPRAAPAPAGAAALLAPHRDVGRHRHRQGGADLLAAGVDVPGDLRAAQEHPGARDDRAGGGRHRDRGRGRGRPQGGPDGTSRGPSRPGRRRGSVRLRPRGRSRSCRARRRRPGAASRRRPGRAGRSSPVPG